jgi:hypothetical protein
MPPWRGAPSHPSGYPLAKSSSQGALLCDGSTRGEAITCVRKNEKAHKLSKPYPKYTEAETNQKLEYAQKAADKDVGPHTCAFVQQDLHFPCPEECLAKKWNLKSPVGPAPLHTAPILGMPDR